MLNAVIAYIHHARSRSLAAALLMGAITLTPGLQAAAKADQVTVTTALGEVSVQAQPQKTVIFDLAALDIAQALGVAAAGVPDTPMPDYLASTRATPMIGTLFEPDYEAVHRLAPDLIIVGGRSAPKHAELARIAPTIDVTPDPAHLLDSVVTTTRSIAAIYQKQDEAETRIARLKESVKTLQALTADAGTGLVILTTGGRMSAYGPGSRFGIIHDSFGMAPAASDLEISGHGQAISFEFIHRTNPDWLFVIDRDNAIGRDGSPARKLLDNALIHKTRAWQNERIVYLDPMTWYLLGSAGLTSMQYNIDELIAVLRDSA